MSDHFHHKHTIHREHVHHSWDRALTPQLRIAPGESVQFETLDASSGQLNRTSTAANLAKLDLGQVNPVTGPVYIDGAQPGDALKVTVLSFRPSGWGGPAISPALVCSLISSRMRIFTTGTTMQVCPSPLCSGPAEEFL